MNWQKKLKRMKLEHLEKTSPDFFRLSGGYKMHVKPYHDKNRDGLIKSLSDWITFSGGSAKKIDKGSMRKIAGKMVWVNAPGKRIDADILAVYKSKSLEILIRHNTFSCEVNVGGWRISVSKMDDFVQWWENEFQDAGSGVISST